MLEVDELREYRNKRTVVYTEFLEDYNKLHSKICYGFVEGKDDSSYYRCLINKELPSLYKVCLYPSGNKESVKKTYECFDWRRFSKNRIVFFIDKDLSLLISDNNIINDKNVYITEKYSIENDIVNKDTCEAILRETMGFATTRQESINYILDLFDKAKDDFERAIMPIMANIIFWKRNNISPANYNNIKVKDIIKVDNGKVHLLKNREELINLIYTQSGVDISKYSNIETRKIEQEIADIYTDITRGKYLSIFFILFCNSIYNDRDWLNIKKTHTGTTLGEGDMMRIVAPRCRLSDTLKSFIQNTLLQYVQHVNN